MRKSVKITTKEGYGDCSLCGGYGWGSVKFEFPTGQVQEYSYSDHMGPAMSSPIDGCGSPRGMMDFVQGYAQALSDQGFEIEHIDLSEGE